MLPACHYGFEAGLSRGYHLTPRTLPQRPGRSIDYPGMDPAGLDRLRFLLAALREPPPSQESERQALAAFERVLGRRAGQREDRGRPRRQDRS